MRVTEDADQRTCQAGVHFDIKEAGGEARVSQSSCPADPVNVLVNILRQVVVDHLLNSPGMKKTKQIKIKTEMFWAHLISRPRAATAVATNTGFLPVLKSFRAFSLSGWRRSPWMLVAQDSMLWER